VAAKTTAPYTLRLSGELTIRTITDAHHKLANAYAKKGEMQLDTSAVSEADLSLVQLIEAARRSANADGKRFTLSPPPSEALRQVLQRAGFPTDGTSFGKGE
jgi:ABC-type transporter Mla MlaB component